MEHFAQLTGLTAGMLNLFVVLFILWEMVWKMIAFWRAARNHHLGWFICIGVFNTVGLLPIIYLLTHRNKTVCPAQRPEA